MIDRADYQKYPTAKEPIVLPKLPHICMNEAPPLGSGIHSYTCSCGKTFAICFEDPLGAVWQEQKNDALRDDAGKVRFELVPVEPLTELAKVYTFGAQKYAPDNWRKGMNWSRCIGSMMRHLFAFCGGETHDQESKLHHLAHVAWGCFTLMEYYRCHLGVDDRLNKGQSSVDTNLDAR